MAVFHRRAAQQRENDAESNDGFHSDSGTERKQEKRGGSDAEDGRLGDNVILHDVLVFFVEPVKDSMRPLYGNRFNS